VNLKEATQLVRAADCELSDECEPYFQYNMLTKNPLFRRKNVGDTNQIAELV